MKSHERKNARALVLWGVFLAPALAWFSQLTASYTIAAYACDHDQMWILHAISIAALGIASAGVWTGWREWRMPGSGENGEGHYLTGGTLLLAVLFLLAIVVGELSNWLLEPCI